VHDEDSVTFIARLAWILMLAGSAAMARSAQSVTDPQSGARFPAALTPPGGGSSQQLTGTATREKTIFRIDVYAYGLYVDAARARATLETFAAQPLASLERGEVFFQRLLEMQIPMTLRIVMLRDVKGAALGQAFDDALKPRVAMAPPTSTGLDGRTALGVFRAYFNLREAARGTEIVFSCGAGTPVTTAVNGDVRPPIDSPALCRALFDVYLGTKPVSIDGRRAVIAGFPALLARR
jgi:hypothetical protein